MFVDTDFVIVTDTLRPPDVQGLDVVRGARKNSTKETVQVIVPVGAYANRSAPFYDGRVAEVSGQKSAKDALL